MRVWTKNANCWEILKFFDENSIEELNFFIFFENLLLKIKLSEITPVFYNNFFRFRGGGGEFPPSPWLRPWFYSIRASNFFKKRYILIPWLSQMLLMFWLVETGFLQVGLSFASKCENFLHTANMEFQSITSR